VPGKHALRHSSVQLPAYQIIYQAHFHASDVGGKHDGKMDSRVVRFYGIE